MKATDRRKTRKIKDPVSKAKGKFQGRVSGKFFL